VKEEKIREGARDYLNSFLTKGGFCFNDLKKLYLAISSLVKDTYTCDKKDFISYFLKFRTDIENGITFKEASDSFLTLLKPIPVKESVDFVQVEGKQRKTRADAYQEYRIEYYEDKYKGKKGYKRESEKYKGKQRSKIWDDLIRAHHLLSGETKSEWEQIGISEEGWTDLFIKVSEAIENKIPEEDLEDYTGYSEEALIKMMEDMYALRKVFDIFCDEVKAAVDRQKPDDKTFLNTISKVWGKRAIVISDYFDTTQKEQRGRDISNKIINARVQRIKNILSSGEFEKIESGIFYSRDLRTFLCWTALAVYEQLVEFPAFYKKAMSEIDNHFAPLEYLEKTCGVDIKELLERFPQLKALLMAKISFKSR
jgi:hypothetical protein